jgi:hypothetical protein
MEKLKSEGICIFCNKTFTGSGMSKHLNSHFLKNEPQKDAKSFHLKVEQNPKYGKAPYFLNLWVSDKAKIQDIDYFLRDIWLECCGHLSNFIDFDTLKKARQNFFSFGIDEDEMEIDMNKKVSKVLYDGQKIIYDYDFGSTTSLLLTVMSILPIKATKKITLLTRNEPLEIYCGTCKTTPATQICATHQYSGDGYFCDKCAKKHAKSCDDFADYTALSIKNSPRMGVCGYEGGAIDMQRDGVFVKK